MYKSWYNIINLNTYLLLPGDLGPRLFGSDLPSPSPTPSLGSKALTDRGIRTPTSGDQPPSTTSCPATAPPTAGRRLATASTTAAGRSTAGHSARSGRATRSPPRGTSRTPSATTTASPHGGPERDA